MKKLLGTLAIVLVAATCLFWSCSTSKQTLHIYTFADFFNLDLLEQFEKKYNCRIAIDTFDSNESMYAKLRLGGGGYDLITPTNNFLEVLNSQGMLQKIDHARIPNAINLDENVFHLLDKSTLDYGLPYVFAFSGIAWRTDKISCDNPSYAIFGDEQYRGRMVLLNDLREALGAALRYKGYSVNTTDPKELEEAKMQLIAWKNNIAKFENEQYKNGIANGEYLVVQGYNGDILQVIGENEHVAFAMPKEGTGISIDFFVIPKEAKHVDLAYEFINYFYDPVISAKNMNFTCFLSPNRAAYALVDDFLKSQIAPFLDEQTLKKSELVKDLGSNMELYYKAWEEVKTAT
ncbi:MAG: spermidine/putrescine ABC transporter substrate-binding protein [Verrucomicrobia bacterium]|nr:spermidine/putrescine ABC transporter substrate-binding protein [Verrucomicrobiota bacterium]